MYGRVLRPYYRLTRNHNSNPPRPDLFLYYSLVASLIASFALGVFR
jgi:hypothetical protein